MAHLRFEFDRLTAIMASISAAIVVDLFVPAAAARAENGPFASVVCPKEPEKIPKISRSSVYKNVPFKAGEKTTFELSYSGMKAGYAEMEVKPPSKHDGVWHRIFSLDAKTGDWFKSIFYGHDQAIAYSRPWDFGVSKFYMEQFEEPIFRKPYISKKWLDFDHSGCRVHEKVWKPARKEQKGSYGLVRGAMDALGALMYLRTLDYKVGERRRALIYTSEKNWWLEADPVAIETIKTPIGSFDAVKLKLRTYLGKVLQQKGDINLWISTGTKERQLLQIQGEIKIGTVWARMINYQPGR